MKLAIMQPYFMPYLGYWQLMNAVDQYVVYDDVNFINRGWIHRNRILMNGCAHDIHIPLSKVSQNKKINEITLLDEEKPRQKLLRTIAQSNARAPRFSEAFPVIREIILFPEKNLSGFLYHQHQVLSAYMGMTTNLLLSSALEKDNSLKGKDKVLAICELLGADVYLNSAGGQELYSKEEFAAHGIELRFLQMNDIRYAQFRNDPVPGLSIIDVMMFNSGEEIRQLLAQYTLI